MQERRERRQMLLELIRESRVAVRALLRAPGYAAVAVLTLALGIAATTSMYAILERVVLDPLPYPQAERLVRLKSAVPSVGPDVEWDVSEGAWWFFRAEARSVETLGGYGAGGANVLGPEGPERARIAVLTASTLRLLGARAAVGRLIDDQDDGPGAPRVVVLSYGFWQRQFGANPAVIGEVLDINEQPAEIIGVMERGVELPPELGVPAQLVGTDLWLPLRLNPAGPFMHAHTQFRTIARLQPGVTVEAAQAEFERLTARLPDAVPSVYAGERGAIESGGFATRVYSLKEYAVGEISSHLWILFGAVGLVLLIACANVANLFLVRIEARRQEVAIRSALGAGRVAIVRHFLAETLVLALSAGVLALLFAFWGVDWLVTLAPDGVPRLQGVRPDGSVGAFAFGLVLVIALVLGLLPALRYGGAAEAGELAEGGRRATAGRQRQRARSGLVVGQVALALVLLVAAGLLIESFRRLRAVDPGIRPEGVVAMQVYLPFARYDEIPGMWAFYDAALQRIRAVPGVAAAGFAQELPFNDGYGCTVQGFEDQRVYERLSQAELTTCAGQVSTSPGYFEALGIPLVQGRLFADADNHEPARGAVIVSRAFAARFWPGEDPIGKGVAPNGMTTQGFYRVVGVVGDVYSSSVLEESAVAIYYPVVRRPETTGWWPNPMWLTARTSAASPIAMVEGIQRAIQQVDPSIPVAYAQEMQTIVDRSMARLSFMMALIAIAGSLALLLAAIGLYGVISYLVTRRTNEIGVRMALGARPTQVERLVVTGSIRLAALGLALGVLAAVALTRLLAGMLYGVQPTHPAAYLGGAVLLSAVAAVAAWIPARRAARIDPVDALRVE
ncbi:MAG: ABC transporter permease [Longimicrobiales bacterium]